VIPLFLFVTRPTIPQSAAKSNFRLLDYNTHQALTFDGWLDPEGLAQFIETEKPDVIALQEISRGWLIAGSLDVAEWLSRRLQMPYVYAPGHDYQFGNMIITRMPITDWSFSRLPLLNVPLGRTLMQVHIDLGNGKTMTVIKTHLSAYAATESRIPQVNKVIEAWNRAPRTLIMGDMNAHPGDKDMALFLNAGFTSAQDVAGDPKALTFTSGKPYERIDWIFGTSEIAFSDFKIPQTQVSDHFPLVVNVTVR
jgi:endonuclease/exonuclease/phosphatase family metal-dependent hydrolase